MLIWIIAALAALGLVAFQYWRERRGPLVGAAALRLVALTLAAALLLDAPRGRASTRPPVVALDASASWVRGGDSSAWRDALARARAAARGDTLWLVGDSLRRATDDAAPADAASRVEPATDRALGAGRPLVLFTDGEVDDARALERLVGGSRVDAAVRADVYDAAALALELPRSTVSGDTIEVLLRVVAGPRGAPAGAVSFAIDRMPPLRVPTDSMGPNAERDVRARLRVPLDGGAHRLVRASISVAGDAVPQNDSLAAALDVVAVPNGVFVSTAPDQDSRFALDVLRGALSLAVRAYYRVAPGVWRQEPGFTAVTEAAVRQALADAPLAIIHGDTSLFGAPRSFTTGALALIVPAASAAEDWFVAEAPTSPLTGALTGIPWDSLAPIALGGAPRGDWIGLTVRQPRAPRDVRPVIAGSEQPRRVIVASGSGFWRWRFRGGQSSDAYGAVWGGVFDWLAAGGDDRRAAVPAAAWTRAGVPVAWRRGARRDSVVIAELRKIGDARVDSVTLRFPGDATGAESPPLPVGEYEIAVPGGRTFLAVAQSREWLPRKATVAAGEIGSGAASGFAPRLRDAWWAYVTLLAALCVEWFIRRRAGLR